MGHSGYDCPVCHSFVPDCECCESDEPHPCAVNAAPPSPDADVEALVDRMHEERHFARGYGWACGPGDAYKRCKEDIRTAVLAGRASRDREAACHGCMNLHDENKHLQAKGEQLRARVGELEAAHDGAFEELNVRRARIASLEAQLAEATKRAEVALSYGDAAEARGTDYLDEIRRLQGKLRAASLPQVVTALEAAEQFAYVIWERVDAWAPEAADVRDQVRAALHSLSGDK